MIVKATYTFEFDVDTSSMDPKFVNIEELSKDLTKRELDSMIANNEITSDDFTIVVDKDAKSDYPSYLYK